MEVVNRRLSSYKPKNSQFSSWHSKMKGNWFGLKTHPFIGKESEKSSKDGERMVWTLPKEG